jgi:hypothetical protein
VDILSDIEHWTVDVQRFKEAVWGVERENFRPGDALNALERAKVEPPLTPGAVDVLREIEERAAEFEKFGVLMAPAWVLGRARAGLNAGGQ